MMDQSHQNLRQGMVLLAHLAAQEHRAALARHEIIINRPVKRLAVRPVYPILMYPGSKARMLNIQQKYPARLQGFCHIGKYTVNIRHIVQRQIGDYAVPAVRRIFILLHAAQAIFHLGISIAPPCLRQHPLAQVNAKHPRSALLRSIFTMPAVAAAQIQHAFPL